MNGPVCACESRTHAHTHAYIHTAMVADRSCMNVNTTHVNGARLLAETGAAISDCLHARALPGCRLPYTHSRCVPPLPLHDTTFHCTPYTRTYGTRNSAASAALPLLLPGATTTGRRRSRRTPTPTSTSTLCTRKSGNDPAANGIPIGHIRPIWV